jgi:hypothetical protein
MRDPRIRTRKWAAEHPVATGVVGGTVIFLVEFGAVGAFGSLMYGVALGASFTVTAFSERWRRRRKGDEAE